MVGDVALGLDQPPFNAGFRTDIVQLVPFGAQLAHQGEVGRNVAGGAAAREHRGMLHGKTLSCFGAVYALPGPEGETARPGAGRKTAVKILPRAKQSIPQTSRCLLIFVAGYRFEGGSLFWRRLYSFSGAGLEAGPRSMRSARATDL